ncbi:MFS transporter [Corynebacterium gerontici]|uniref:Major Facilitator Superfamily protein n=1 Tax=Corynebacterium gerontici TaxID=2079234 RepID=A0A3G6IZ52_9CORY|nr:MFS transporter [Corynebacterium gerontici]AZA11071.1 Major Facilitator Superfamily protein [Corynebacterium gerontici]
MSEKRNATLFVYSNALQNIGDNIVAAKTVLPWIFAALGVPHAFTSMLVPIRESGSMLPQALITGWVLKQPSRKRVWIIGSLGQAAAAAGIGIAALFLRGWAMGIVSLCLLAVFALTRSLCSISSKDVQGRTISKGKRGRVSGRAAAVGGIASLIVGLGLALLGQGAPSWALACLIIAAATMWVFASLVFRNIEEPEAEPQHTKQAASGWLSDCFDLLRKDRDFLRFVSVRSLLLVTALSTAFLVTLAHEKGSGFGGLAIFMIVNGVATFVGSWISGKLSDISSKKVMEYGSAVASISLLLTITCIHAIPSSTTLLLPTAFFLVTVVHSGIRVARKTYVVDMAEGDERTKYVANANTLMGLVLLGVGGISAVFAHFGADIAVVFLAIMGLLGSFLARGMKDVSANAGAPSK